jgi:mono/diheme cytochrome c family protein
MRLLQTLLLVAVGLKALPAVAADPIAVPVALPADHAERMTKGLGLFKEQVAGLLKKHCIKCHGDKIQGDLDFATREGLLKGGTNGPAVVPFQPAKSYLLTLIKHEDEPAMPDSQPKLPDAEIAAIERWIELGAPYDEPLIAGKKPPRDASVVTAEDRSWWSFQPLAKVTPPKVEAPLVQNDIDRFIIHAARAKNLSLAPPAEKRQLVRRLYLDLLGIPPTPAEMADALADTSANATAKLIDQLLARPEYGERWARHWLDVARFAESAGFEQDYDRAGAWAYRDFVIRALNEDMPFDQFLRWQLAGDEVAPDDAWALAATGFLGAGVFPTQITANEVERTRYDALDDMLSTTSSAFLGLTVGCARCHDHKFDPIPTRDYYRMLSTFTTTVRSNIDVELDPVISKNQREQWAAELAPLQAELKASQEKLRGKFDAWVAAGLAADEKLPWLPLEITELQSKEKATFKKLEDESYLVEGTNAAHDSYTIIGTSGLKRITGIRLDALAHESLPHKGPGRAANGNFGLSTFSVQVRTGEDQANEVTIKAAAADFEQNKKNLAIAGSIDDLPLTGWAVDGQIGRDHAAVFTLAKPLELAAGAMLIVKLDFAVNGQHNLGRFRVSLTGDAKPALDIAGQPPEMAKLLLKFATKTPEEKLSAKETEQLFAWWSERDPEYRRLKTLVTTQQAKEPKTKTKILICGEGYTPLRHHTQGADFFKETHLLDRGNVDKKKEVVTPGFLQVIGQASASTDPWFKSPPDKSKFSGRRTAMAAWLTDVDQGAGTLAARVIVNRLWQHHFGAGIVTTPNDFGKTGALPSHPELLDWLAGELIRNGWRLKPIQRLMLESAAYQQTSHPDKKHVEADPFNALFTRFSARRLEGETLRDSILAVTGELDKTMFGPGTKDEKSKRRSIYFTVKRSQLIGSMVVFDQPEPSISQGSRPTTTIAPQALLLMNGSQVRAWAVALAKRLESKLPAAETPNWQPAIAEVYQVALGRTPRDKELAAATAALDKAVSGSTAKDAPAARLHAFIDFCQVVLGLNEFAYLE